jgi:hypothetical protein
MDRRGKRKRAMPELLIIQRRIAAWQALSHGSHCDRHFAAAKVMSLAGGLLSAGSVEQRAFCHAVRELTEIVAVIESKRYQPRRLVRPCRRAAGLCYAFHNVEGRRCCLSAFCLSAR